MDNQDQTDLDLDFEGLESKALAIMSQAIEEHKPSHVFAMFSGGHDSLAATRVASKHPRFSGAVHINTGIGIEETREFVRETCAREGWPLKEYRAREDAGQDYEQLVLERGFPGPGHHYKMYSRLKERCIRLLTKEHKRHWRDRIMLVTGCRQQESSRRMGHVQPIKPEGIRVWVAPIYDWHKAQCSAYILREGLQPNWVVQTLHMSGECLCGAFAHKGELAEIDLWFPKTAKYIRDLECRVKAAGHCWGWEQQPPKGKGKTLRDPSGRIKAEKRQELCTTCIHREELVERDAQEGQ